MKIIQVNIDDIEANNIINISFKQKIEYNLKKKIRKAKKNNEIKYLNHCYDCYYSNYDNG